MNRHLHRPRTLSLLLASALCLASGAFVLWQNAHVAVLWDLSYLLDSSYRFALASVGEPQPYRDLPFVHAPLTFLVQSWIIRMTGRVYWHHIAYAAMAGALATLLTWRILLRLLRERVAHSELIACLLTLPLIPLGIYGIYQHPIYDSDAILSVLFALWCLLRMTPHTRFAGCFLTGAALVLPLFYKQNIGLFFLAASVAAIVAVAAAKQRQHRPWRSEFTVLLGAGCTLAAALVVVQLTAGLRQYFYWTITFAAQRRLPGVGPIATIYHQTSLLWTIPAAVVALVLLTRYGQTLWGRWAALALLAAPFVYTLLAFALLDDVSDRTDQLLSLWPHLLALGFVLAVSNLWRRQLTLTALLPIVLLMTIHGTFLSQQLWGSTYALWPLLMLLIACMIAAVPRLATGLAAIIPLTLLVCGSMYALSQDRLSYAHLDGAPQRSALLPLRGLSTPGPWLPALDELVADTDRNIPRGDTIVLFPGQDPFYYATGRMPRFPVLLFDPATNPYSPSQLADAMQHNNVRWLIVPKHLQLTQPPLPNYDEFLAALTPLFMVDHGVSGYTIYRRRSNARG